MGPSGMEDVMKFFGWLIRWLLMLTGLTTLIFAAAAGTGLYFAADWLRESDAAVPSDAIVALGGDYRRVIAAADLYGSGYGRKVYIANVRSNPAQKDLTPLGISLPRDEDFSLRILRAKGVPGTVVATYGNELRSTAREAAALAEALPAHYREILVVTSPYHIRRARLILERAMPGRKIRMVATPYETFPKQWWTDQDAARAVVLECAKLAFYLAGGRF